MNIDEFGRSIKNKYPQYKDMRDADVGRLILKKYPQYQDLVQEQAAATKGMGAASQPVKKSLGQRIASFAKGEVMGNSPASKTVGGSIIQSTIGSRGLLGAFQQVGKTIAQPFALDEQVKLSNRINEIAAATTKLVQQRSIANDPEQKARLTRLIDVNWKSIKDMTDSRSGFDPFVTTPRESLGTTVNALLTAATGGKSVASRIGAQGARGLSIRAIEQGLVGAGYATGAALTDDRLPTKSELGVGAVVGTAFPVGGAAASKIKQSAQIAAGSLSRRMIGSLIKPAKGLLSYGKDPAGQVAREKIVANSLDQLISKVREKRNQIGLEIGELMDAAEQSGISLNLDGVLSPIEVALQQAKRNPRTNAALIQRLVDTRDDLLQVMADETGNFSARRTLTQVTPRQAFNLKEDIASLTKWTGNDSDDKLVNKSLQQAYTGVRKIIEQGVDGIGALNERWGNLLSAEKAAERAANNELRRNLVSLSLRISGVGAGVGGVAASIISGNPAPAILGLGITGMEYLFGTPAAKTRLAKWLAAAGPREREALYQRIPVMRNVVERIFGPDVADGAKPVLPKGSLKSSGKFAAGIGLSLDQPEIIATDAEGKTAINPVGAAIAVGSAALIGGAARNKLQRASRQAKIDMALGKQIATRSTRGKFSGSKVVRGELVDPKIISTINSATDRMRAIRNQVAILAQQGVERGEITRFVKSAAGDLKPQDIFKLTKYGFKLLKQAGSNNS